MQVAEDFTYLRFHGPEGGYRGSYDEAILAGYAARIVNGIKNGRDMYVYFNNTIVQEKIIRGKSLAPQRTIREL